MKDFQGSVESSEMLWPGAVLSFNIYVLFFFFFVNQRLNLRQTFFFSVCVMADGECRCVLFCLKENLFFCWLILLSLFNFIHLQELYKSRFYM